MNISWRQGAVFAGGVLIGGLGVGLLASHSQWGGEAPHAPQVAANAPAHQVVAARAAPASETATASTPAAAPCPASAIVPAADGRDGQFELLGDLSASRPTDAGAFIVIGKEAAASGRPRDAEVAFLMACRVAEKAGATDPVGLADAKYQLAWHYGNVGRDRPGHARDALVTRAEALYADSLGVYTAKLGHNHEKARFAANGLAALKQPPASASASGPAKSGAATGAGAQVQAKRGSGDAPERAQAPQARSAQQATSRSGAGQVSQSRPGPRPESPTAARDDTRLAGAGPERSPAATTQKPRPSFECAKARSVPERIICSDAQLAQLDRELGSLYSRVKSGADDPAGFKRRSDEEWRQREASCRDRECLLAWYAHRRAELLDELDAQRGNR